ncbi:MAG: OmpH family outer membrane protein [Bdellovibrionota bacterium]
MKLLNVAKTCVVLVFMLVAVSARAELKIGVVNMQKAIQGSAAGKKAKAELEGDFEKKKKELQKKETDLKKMSEDLERKKSVMSEEAFQQKQAGFQEEMMKFRQIVGTNQMEIQKKEQDLTGPIIEKMRKVIAKIAKEKGYNLILENTAMVLYHEAALDITDEILKAFEKEK